MFVQDLVVKNMIFVELRIGLIHAYLIQISFSRKRLWANFWSPTHLQLIFVRSIFLSTIRFCPIRNWPSSSIRHEFSYSVLSKTKRHIFFYISKLFFHVESPTYRLYRDCWDTLYIIAFEISKWITLKANYRRINDVSRKRDSLLSSEVYMR